MEISFYCFKVLWCDYGECRKGHPGDNVVYCCVTHKYYIYLHVNFVGINKKRSFKIHMNEVNINWYQLLVLKLFSYVINVQKFKHSLFSCT